MGFWTTSQQKWDAENLRQRINELERNERQRKRLENGAKKLGGHIVECYEYTQAFVITTQRYVTLTIDDRDYTFSQDDAKALITMIQSVFKKK